MNEPVKIICPYCYSPDLDMYLQGLGSAAAGTMHMPAGNVENNNMELKCNACGHIFKPSDGKLSQEAIAAQQYTAPVAAGSMRPDEAHILTLNNTQGKLTAIKYCCDTYGWGLKESKDYVDHITGDATYTKPVPPRSGAPDAAQVASVLQFQGKLHAVKYVKEQTGWGLKESKDYVDALAGQQHIPVKKEGCFIATACYGSYDAPEVQWLRRYRDVVLARSVAGRLFIRTYYYLSPRPAAWLARHPQWQTRVRRYLLQPLLHITGRY